MMCLNGLGAWLKSLRVILLAGATLAAGPSAAEPATAEGARAIVETFARNLGRFWIDKDIIDVKPVGERYDLVYDVNSAKLGLSPKGIEFSLKPITLQLIPKEGHRFAFELQNPAIELTYKESMGIFSEDGSLKLENCAGNGLFDLEAFIVIEGNLHCEGSKASSGVAAVRTETSTGRVNFTVAGKASEDGGVDGRISFEVVDLVETTGVKLTDDIALPLPKSEMVFKADKISREVSVSGLRKAGLMKALAFVSERFLAGPGTASREEVEALAKDIMPLWRSASLTMHYGNLSWSIPFGTAEAAAIDATASNDGLLKNSVFDHTLTVSGLHASRDRLPAWLVALVPEKLRLTAKLKDVDLETLVNGLIEAATRIAPAASGEMHALLLRVFATNGATLAFDAVVGAADYDVKAQGTSTIFPSRLGTAAVSAAGLDAVAAALGKAATEQPQARNAALGIAFLKGLAKAGPDGRLSWDVDFDSLNRRIRVNGQSFGPGGPK